MLSSPKTSLPDINLEVSPGSSLHFCTLVQGRIKWLKQATFAINTGDSPVARPSCDRDYLDAALSDGHDITVSSLSQEGLFKYGAHISDGLLLIEALYDSARDVSVPLAVRM
jgi:hypothetical protein